jgi:hypothetical protein
MMAHTSSACGANAAATRQKTITTALVSVDASQAAFIAYDGQHQLDIVAAAKTREEAEKNLADYRAKRAKFNLVIKSAYAAIGVAAQVDNDHSVSGMVMAAAMVAQELATLGVTP